ncbi:MAG: hypothetical protein KTR31_27500 [Myxococcales bacterium]|nr:hypothetical protein [Myxococcales bacterium]
MSGLLTVHPAEAAVGVVTLLLLGALTLAIRSRWRRVERLALGLAGAAAVGVAMGGVWLARARELAAVAVIRDVGRDQLATHVALQHASAMQGLWWWLLLAGALVAVPRGGRSDEVATSARSVLLVIAGLLFVVGVYGGSLPVVLCAAALGSLPLLALGAAAGWVAGALVLAAAACGIESTLASTWMLADPETDLTAMQRAFSARRGVWLVIGVAVVAVAVQRVRNPSTAPRMGAFLVGTSLIGAGALVGTVVVRDAAHQARAWGPPPELGPLAEELSLPVYAQSALPRFVGGCVWWPDGESASGWRAAQLGHVSARHAIGGCVEGVDAPRLEDRPVLAVGKGHPVADLAERGRGELQLVVRTDAQAAAAPLMPWRIGAVAVQVLHPSQGRWRELPGPVVVTGTSSERVLRRPDGVTVPVDDDLVGAMTRALEDASLRVDLVAAPEARLTVGELLALCGAARAVHPKGLRCAVRAPDLPDAP